MTNPKKLLAATFVVSTIIGCASPFSTPPPTGSVAYNGTDEVGDVDSKMLVGTWDVATINPKDGSMKHEMRYEFMPDGTSKSIHKVDDGKETGPMEFEVKGEWSANGETFSQTVMSVEEMNGKAFSLFGVALDLGLTEGRSTSSNVYESGTDHFVVVDDTTGIAG